jgi:multisubunit Na+/H+ antiporter MnhG subunit
VTTSIPSVDGALTGARSTEQGKGRSARLAERVARLRTRAATGNLHVWLLVLGGVLMPLGFVFILLGWLGASRTPLPFEQTSYLISGGIFGLALVIAGGFIYFAYWETVRIRESREQAQTLAAAMLRLESALQATGAGAAEAGVTTTYVATANGSIFHRQDCTVVAGRTDLRRIDPERDGLAPCRICDPLADGR